MSDKEKTDSEGGVNGSIEDVEIAVLAASPPSNAPPNGGLTAWLQVVGSFFLMMNSW